MFIMGLLPYASWFVGFFSILFLPLEIVFEPIALVIGIVLSPFAIILGNSATMLLGYTFVAAVF